MQHGNRELKAGELEGQSQRIIYPQTLHQGGRGREGLPHPSSKMAENLHYKCPLKKILLRIGKV
jgi:hypothetical protein